MEPKKNYIDSISLDYFLSQAWNTNRGSNNKKLKWTWLTTVYDWKTLFKSCKVIFLDIAKQEFSDSERIRQEMLL